MRGPILRIQDGAVRILSYQVRIFFQMPVHLFIIRTVDSGYETSLWINVLWFHVVFDKINYERSEL